MNALMGFVNSFITILYNALKWCLDGLLIVCKMALYWFFDGMFTVVITFISALNFGNLAINDGWGILPANVVYCIDQVGLGTGLTMIGAAILIRVSLNLIPSIFTRV